MRSVAQILLLEKEMSWIEVNMPLYRVGAYCTPTAVLLTGKTEEKTHEGLTA